MEEDTVDKRIQKPFHHIDAGFINRRKCLNTFSKGYRDLYEKHKSIDNDHMSVLSNDHLLIYLALKMCQGKCPALHECLSYPRKGQVFCSLLNVKPCNEDVYHDKRVSNNIDLGFESDYSVTLEYHTEHLYSDTQRHQLDTGD